MQTRFFTSANEPVFPFINTEDYASSATFYPFSQDGVLKEGQKGLCLALCYEWLGSFYDSTTFSNNPFFEKVKTKAFIEKMNTMQDHFDLPDIMYRAAFKIKISAIAEQYGFNRLARMPDRSSIEMPGIDDLISDSIINIAGKIIFLSKNNPNDKEGHAIAIACKMTECGIQIGLFEPNFGQALFTFSALEDTCDFRHIWEVNDINDNREPKVQKTIYEFCAELFQHYASSSPYTSYRYVSMDHTLHQKTRNDKTLEKIRFQINEKICPREQVEGNVKRMRLR
ncbi:MAG TPA: hypothetical protein VLJ15_02885 [Gammaproteobacteria bacterium]|nr:hypothetical protein [Gammaproteobacteria bacterium]